MFIQLLAFKSRVEKNTNKQRRNNNKKQYDPNINIDNFFSVTLNSRKKTAGGKRTGKRKINIEKCSHTHTHTDTGTPAYHPQQLGGRRELSGQTFETSLFPRAHCLHKYLTVDAHNVIVCV